MLKYLKKAFWAGPVIPGIGRLPVNALAALGFGILGFGHPAFWLLGAGLEAGYLTLLASDRRFQKWVDRQRRQPEAEPGWQEIVETLGSEARQRLAALQEKIARALRISRDAQADDDFTLESSRDALERLRWIYLKLLVGRDHLAASWAQASQADLGRQIDGLERELASESGSSSLRESQAATLKILQQRLRAFERREQTLREIDSDLARIEAQVDLALESSSLRGGGAAVTANLELASELLEDGLYFGDSESAVAALDRAYGVPGAPRSRVPE